MRVSARVLDGVYGRSAVGMHARIERIDDDGWWVPVAAGESDLDGYIADWDGTALESLVHRIVFDCDRYFAALGMTASYPEVTVTFRSPAEDENCQIQVVLAPSSYSAHFQSGV